MARKVSKRRSRIPRSKTPVRRSKLRLRQRQAGVVDDDLIKLLENTSLESNIVPSFNTTGEILTKVRTNIAKPRDCVINALEAIGIVDNRVADFMRIMVGDTGLMTEQVEAIFDYEYKAFKFVFYETSIEYLNYYVTNEMSNVSVIFCGIEYPTGEKHVFLIGKDADGKGRYIDAQSQYNGCFLDVCYQNVLPGRRFYLLRRKPTDNVNQLIEPQYAPMEP